MNVKPESSNDGEDLPGIAALEEEVRQLLEGEPEVLLVSGITDTIQSIEGHHYVCLYGNG